MVNPWEVIGGAICGLGIGFILLTMAMAGRNLASPIGGPPTANPPRGTWPRGRWVQVFDQFERAVHFRFGKLRGEKSFGIRFRIPIVDEYMIVDIRDRPENIPGQVCITRDNVSIKVDGVVYWKVIEPVRAVMSTADPSTIIRQVTMSTLRAVIGEFSLDELLMRRDVISNRMETLLDQFSHPLGIDITRVDVTDVTIPTDLQRAMAREAEAQRERRARLRRAEGEVEAVKNLAHAAHTMNKHPELLELRRLQAVSELGMEQSTLISLVLPYDYGHLGGGSKDKQRYSDDDNQAYLDSLEVAEDEDAGETGHPAATEVSPAAPTPQAAAAPSAAAPPAPADTPPADSKQDPATDWGDALDV